MRLIQGLFLLLLFVVALAFAVINSEAVVVDFYVGSRSLPLSVVLFGAFALGALVGAAVGLLKVLRIKGEMARLRRAEREAQRELDSLRALPVRQEP